MADGPNFSLGDTFKVWTGDKKAAEEGAKAFKGNVEKEFGAAGSVVMGIAELGIKATNIIGIAGEGIVRGNRILRGARLVDDQEFAFEEASDKMQGFGPGPRNLKDIEFRMSDWMTVGNLLAKEKNTHKIINLNFKTDFEGTLDPTTGAMVYPQLYNDIRGEILAKGGDAMAVVAKWAKLYLAQAMVGANYKDLLEKFESGKEVPVALRGLQAEYLGLLRAVQEAMYKIFILDPDIIDEYKYVLMDHDAWGMEPRGLAMTKVFNESINKLGKPYPDKLEIDWSKLLKEEKKLGIPAPYKRLIDNIRKDLAATTIDATTWETETGPTSLEELRRRFGLVNATNPAIADSGNFDSSRAMVGNYANYFRDIVFPKLLDKIVPPGSKFARLYAGTESYQALQIALRDYLYKYFMGVVDDQGKIAEHYGFKGKSIPTLFSGQQSTAANFRPQNAEETALRMGSAKYNDTYIIPDLEALGPNTAGDFSKMLKALGYPKEKKTTLDSSKINDFFGIKGAVTVEGVKGAWEKHIKTINTVVAELAKISATDPRHKNAQEVRGMLETIQGLTREHFPTLLAKAFGNARITFEPLTPPAKKPKKKKGDDTPANMQSYTVPKSESDLVGAMKILFGSSIGYTIYRMPHENLLSQKVVVTADRIPAIQEAIKVIRDMKLPPESDAAKFISKTLGIPQSALDNYEKHKENLVDAITTPKADAVHVGNPEVDAPGYLGTVENYVLSLAGVTRLEIAQSVANVETGLNLAKGLLADPTKEAEARTKLAEGISFMIQAIADAYGSNAAAAKARTAAVLKSLADAAGTVYKNDIATPASKLKPVTLDLDNALSRVNNDVPDAIVDAWVIIGKAGAFTGSPTVKTIAGNFEKDNRAILDQVTVTNAPIPIANKEAFLKLVQLAPKDANALSQLFTIVSEHLPDEMVKLFFDKLKGVVEPGAWNTAFLRMAGTATTNILGENLRVRREKIHTLHADYQVGLTEIRTYAAGGRAAWPISLPTLPDARAVFNDIKTKKIDPLLAALAVPGKEDAWKLLHNELQSVTRGPKNQLKFMKPADRLAWGFDTVDTQVTTAEKYITILEEITQPNFASDLTAYLTAIEALL